MRSRRAIALVLLSIAGVAVVGLLSGYGWTGQIRLDSGDLRYRFLEIPIRYERMPEPHRTAILAVAADSRVLRPQWQTCVIYPLPTSNNTDRMCRRFYRDAAAWCAVDRTIARLALEDSATYVIETKAQHSLPESVMILGPEVVRGASGAVMSDWRTSDIVQAYCQKKGYSLPPADKPPRGDGESP